MKLRKELLKKLENKFKDFREPVIVSYCSWCHIKWVDDVLYCPACGNITTRKIRKVNNYAEKNKDS